MRAFAVSGARQKKGIFGFRRAKAGQRPSARLGREPTHPAAGAMPNDQCYEPDVAVRWPIPVLGRDHEPVIRFGRRNKLKLRANYTGSARART